MYVKLTKISDSGETKGDWFMSASPDTIAAMQIIDAGEHNQRTMVYLNGSRAILTVKETPQEIEKLQLAAAKA